MLSSRKRVIIPILTGGVFRNVHAQFVPKHQDVSSADVNILQEFVNNSKRLTIVTGAGISTESGIPDYRSAEVGLYSRNGYKPMNYADFINKHSSRQRYWLRSFLSWNYMHNRVPNAGHLALTNWERSGKLGHLITQNVDRLHHKAGTEKVIELHGSLYTVRCVNCHYRTSRILFQKLMAELNLDLLKDEAVVSLMSNDRNQYAKARPDGDLDVNLDGLTSHFQVPYCENCQGILKPDIIFFGDNVMLDQVKRIYQIVDDNSHLLIVGSSLQVFSSYRFVLHAHKNNKQILILNIGPTRADPLTNVVRLNVKAGDILPQIII